MYNKTISKDELNRLPLIRFEGEVAIIDTVEGLEEILPEIRSNKVLGFDTETRPSFKKGCINNVALIQLSSETKSYLLRLNKIGFSQDIINILTDEAILKIGCSIKDDIFMLNKIASFKPSNFIDLQAIISNYNIDELSLKKITGIVLGKKLSKRQRLSNWESPELKPSQMSYAATDAWICLEIFNTINNS